MKASEKLHWSSNVDVVHNITACVIKDQFINWLNRKRVGSQNSFYSTVGRKRPEKRANCYLKFNCIQSNEQWLPTLNIWKSIIFQLNFHSQFPGIGANINKCCICIQCVYLRWIGIETNRRPTEKERWREREQGNNFVQFCLKMNAAYICVCVCSIYSIKSLSEAKK